MVTWVTSPVGCQLYYGIGLCSWPWNSLLNGTHGKSAAPCGRLGGQEPPKERPTAGGPSRQTVLQAFFRTFGRAGSGTGDPLTAAPGGTRPGSVVVRSCPSSPAAGGNAQAGRRSPGLVA